MSNHKLIILNSWIKIIDSFGITDLTDWKNSNKFQTLYKGF